MRKPPKKLTQTRRRVTETVATDLLVDAAQTISGSRQADYGDPRPNLTLAGILKKAVRDLGTRELCPAEQEAIDMCLTKIARLCTGQKVKRDNYLDLAGYIALAYQVSETDD